MRHKNSAFILALGFILTVAAGRSASATGFAAPDAGPAAPAARGQMLLAFSDQPASMNGDAAATGDAASTDQAAPATDEDSEPGDGMATPEDQALFDEWYKENDICRGHSGDDEETFKHCDARDALTEKLRAKNWCYGHDGQAEYQREWEGCE